jgi:branched-chain amino acid transport system ATP-binding protein
LAAIAGTVPGTGRVVFNGEELRGGVDRRLRSGVALVPENRGLFPRMSVHDHLWLGAHRRPSKADVEFVVDLFPQLGSRSRQSAGSLSGGEAQMLALAMVLLTEPKAFLVDELSFGLAPIIVKDLLSCCRLFAHEKKLAVLVVEQYVETVLEYADYGLVLAHGEIVIRGTSEEVRGRLGDVEMAYLGGETHTL